MASLSDDTPEGKSIVALGVGKLGRAVTVPEGARPVPFTAQTRMSGVDFDGRSIRKGASDAIGKHIANLGDPHRPGAGLPADVRAQVENVAKKGATPLVVADGGTVLGVVQLADVVKDKIKERFGEMRRMGIKTVMITGDNPVTAAAIAAEAGVDDFLAEATPENKLAMIRDYQDKGHLVAMTGDGTNDAPALAQADVAVAMNRGTQAAKEAGNMVDLDSNPTKLLEVVTVGKQMLMTRGALTTFSIANDVSKYFAIIPAAFVGTYPQLDALNIMRLHSPTSAVLSAVIFNALIIIALIPIALRGLKVRAAPAAVTLAPQHPRVRCRRADPAVPVHQADRRPPLGHWGWCHERNPPSRARLAARVHRAVRVRLPVRHGRRRRRAVPAPGDRVADPRQGRPRRRLRADRPAVRQPGVLLEPARPRRRTTTRRTRSAPTPGQSGFIDDKGHLGPNPALTKNAKDRIDALLRRRPGQHRAGAGRPRHASASGLDPDISPGRGVLPGRPRRAPARPVRGRDPSSSSTTTSRAARSASSASRA